MEELVNHFASQFALTEEEQRELVVERGNAGLLQTTKFLLVGKVLMKTPFNKEVFKRTMVMLWRPKARVEIVTLEDDLFMFAFSSRQDRAKILGGGLIGS